jgi:hypothetical protein
LGSRCASPSVEAWARCAQIFEQQHVAHRHLGNSGGSDIAYAIVSKRNRTADFFCQCRCQRCKRLGFIAALGTAKMRQHDRLGPFGRKLAHRGRKTFETRGVAHMPVLHRHVQIGAYQHALAGKVEIVERFERGHGTGNPVGIERIE